MIITNKLDLPKEIYNSVLKSNDGREPIPNRYSVTELLSPIREIILKRKYWKSIKQDISDMMPALFGTAVHKIFEENSNPEEAEVKFEITIGNNTLVGKSDNISGDTITDYKTGTTSKVMKKDFNDWKDQGLSYAYIRYKKYGIITRKLKFYCLLKDWSKIKKLYSEDYPSSPIFLWEYNIQDSDYDYIENKLTVNLNKIEYYNNNSILPECSDEERWYTGTKYAVYKNVSDKKAAIICDTEDEAHGYITNKCGGAGEIEVRKGQNIKCDLYCSVSEFCKKGER